MNDTKRKVTRRGHGEGSIHKRKDGRWVATLDLGWENGKRKRKYFYGDTQREAREKLEGGKRLVHDGLAPAPERQTFGRFLDRWLVDSVKPSVQPRTFVSYADLVRLHISPSLGQLRLQAIGPQEIQAFLNQKTKQGLSASTVKYLHAVVRLALGQAVEWGLAPRNAAVLVRPPRVGPAKVTVMTPEQAQTFLDAIHGHRLEALYCVGLAIGLRQGEALGLRWDDVDLETGTLRVHSQLQRIDGHFEINEPKTKASRRNIDLPDFAVGALREHRVRQLEDRLLAGSNWQEWGLVFCTKRGTPLDAKNVTHRFQELLKRLGLPRMRFHDLRHACATLMLVQGEHPRVVMEILGHSQYSTTMDIYSHVMPSLKRDAARRMDSLLTRQEQSDSQASG